MGRTETDGGNRYTNPTGKGYLGVWTTVENCANISIGALGLDWGVGTDLVAIDVDQDRAIAIVERESVDDEETIIDEVEVGSNNFKTNLRIHSSVLRELAGFEPNSDLRGYSRHGRLFVVPADADPFIEGGGERP